MAGTPPQITVSKAVSLLKSGQYQPALKYLYYLKRNIGILSLNDKNDVEHYFLLCLKILFDKQLVKAEKSLQDNNEIRTSINFINLLDLQNSLYQYSPSSDKTLNHSYKKSFNLFETWVFKVLSTIQSVELKRRHLERHFYEILNLFGYVSSLYIDFFLKIPQLKKYFIPNEDEFVKIQQFIFKEIANYFIEQLNRMLMKENIIQALDYWQKLKSILKMIKNSKKLEIQFYKFELKLTEKLAEIDLHQGELLEQQQDYYSSLQKYKAAFTKYHVIKDESKKKMAKSKYLNAAILLGRWFEDRAYKSELKCDPQKTLDDYEKAKHIFEDINAKKEISRISSRLKKFNEKRGDQLQFQATKLSNDSISEIAQKLSLLNEAKYFYQKGENIKKLKKINMEIISLSKLRYKLLSKSIINAEKAQDYELKFLLLEEMHLLSYEMNSEKNTYKIAKEIEQLKPKINWQKIEQMKKEKYFENLTFSTKTEQDDNAPNLKFKKQLNIFFSEEKKISKPDVSFDLEKAIQRDPLLQITDSPTSKTKSASALIDSTWFTSYESTLKIDPEQTQIISTSAIEEFSQNYAQSRSLKQIYVYLKKHNEGKVLNQVEIKFLYNHGINLPLNSLYYYKFAHIPHQFYVYDNPKGGPQVLMIPRNPLISRRAKFGEILPAIQIYLTGNPHESIIPQNILLSHLQFAQITNNWDDYLGSFQFSSIETYIFFLNAIRLMNNRAEIPEIVKNINASLVAEFINLPSPNMINFFEQFSSFYFIEEFMGISQQINWLLFSIGLKWFYNGNILLASTIWSMLEVS
ncbi:MAG: hypothetical protein K9W44_12165 [Candidatus Lokiarchaeota archaeon]|nr:hypothetical protein [Candidatus Harpocratesius repetitus]